MLVVSCDGRMMLVYRRIRMEIHAVDAQILGQLALGPTRMPIGEPLTLARGQCRDRFGSRPLGRLCRA